MPSIKHATIRYRIIDRCIRNKFSPFPSKQDLRSACEDEIFGGDGEHICSSTIEKDIFAMRQEHDAPIKYSKRDNGYFYEDPDFNIDEVPLTEDELNAIKFASKTLMQFRGTGMFSEFNSALDKISGRIAFADDDSNTTFIQLEKSISGEGGEYLPLILEAIKNRVVIEFEYESFISGIRKRRKVLPLLLKEYKNRWYLISFDLDKNDYITYALDRLDELELGKEKLERPENFNPDNYFKYAVGITSGNSSPVKVKFKADQVAAKYLDTLKLHQSQKVVGFNDDFSVDFEMFVSISEELIRDLLAYSNQIKIIEPIELSQELLKRAKSVVDAYK